MKRFVKVKIHFWCQSYTCAYLRIFEQIVWMSRCRFRFSRIRNLEKMEPFFKTLRQEDENAKIKSSKICSHLVAQPAFKWFFIGVYRPVFCQIAILHEEPSTYFAFEWAECLFAHRLKWTIHLLHVWTMRWHGRHGHEVINLIFRLRWTSIFTIGIAHHQTSTELCHWIGLINWWRFTWRLLVCIQFGCRTKFTRTIFTFIFRLVFTVHTKWPIGCESNGNRRICRNKS